MGCLLGCIPTLPLKLRVDLVGLLSLVVACRVHGGRKGMGALKNLQLEGKSYHQM
jgi:hypothetical protein